MRTTGKSIPSTNPPKVPDTAHTAIWDISYVYPAQEKQCTGHGDFFFPHLPFYYRRLAHQNGGAHSRSQAGAMYEVWSGALHPGC